MIRDLTTESLTLTRLRSGWVIIELNGKPRIKPNKDHPGETEPGHIQPNQAFINLLGDRRAQNMEIWKVKH